MGHSRYSSHEIVERGKQWYQNTIQHQIDEQRERGKALLINIETGDFELDDSGLAASHRLLHKQSDAALYAMRVGFPSYAKIGGGWGSLTK